MPRAEEPGNLWIAKSLFDYGGVQFGDFTIGRTTKHSPIYINPRVLISSPVALKRIAKILEDEIVTKLEKARPEMQPFELVAGIPLGGLHLASAFSLRANIPMVYVNPGSNPDKKGHIEGRFKVGQRVLIIDDLMTSGGSILESTKAFTGAYLDVKNAVVLIDRDQGGKERLKSYGFEVVSLLNLKIMLNYYLSIHYITEEVFTKCMAYLASTKAKSAKRS